MSAVGVSSWKRYDPPELTSPLSAGWRRPRWWAVLVAPVLAGTIAAAVLTRPAIGLAVAGAVLVILVVRHFRFLLTLTAVGLMVSVAVYTVVHQSTYHFPAGGWPINFEPASDLAWTAVVLLAADAIVEIARRGSRRNVATAAAATTEPADAGGDVPGAAPDPKEPAPAAE